MHYIIFVNMIECDANHCENSNNIIFWKKLLYVFFDNVFKASVTFFHYYAWKISLIFDNINYLAYHWVVLQFQQCDFSFRLGLHETVIKLRANLKLKSLSSIYFTVNFRLYLKYSALTTLFDKFNCFKVIVVCPKP